MSKDLMSTSTTPFQPAVAKPIMWTISGADCSGGAGIAADIKTGHCLGMEVCALITANTVQNSKKLISVNPVSIDILQQQFDALLDDKPPHVIKIGLIATLYQLTWLCQVLNILKRKSPQLKVIYDPVGQASVGGIFSNLTVNEILPLFSLIDIITPNLLEAQQLTQLNSNEVSSLGKAIIQLGVKSVIIKGGHNDNPNHCLDYCIETCIDSLIEHTIQPSLKQEIGQVSTTDITLRSYQLSSPRINSHYSHGGGCSFASALASFIAHGYLLRDAFTLAKAFINQGLNAHINKVDYYGAFEQLGWPNNNSDFPAVCSSIIKIEPELTPFASLGITRGTNKKLGLYPVVNSVAWLKRLLPLGLEIIQLRLKNHSDIELDSLIKEAVELSKKYSTRLFINDYWFLAIKHGGYGVHIGQEDIQAADLNAIKKAGLRLGISTHGCYEFLLAQQLQPSYLAIGAIFPTKTKDMTGQIQGLDNLRQILTLSTNIPVVAIGGINLQRSAQVWRTGVDSIAVVTAITEAEEPEQAVEHFRQTLLMANV